MYEDLLGKKKEKVKITDEQIIKALKFNVKQKEKIIEKLVGQVRALEEEVERLSGNIWG
jgi:uncharacterized coiled-coil protein SlyX